MIMSVIISFSKELLSSFGTSDILFESVTCSFSEEFSLFSSSIVILINFENVSYILSSVKQENLYCFKAF